MQSLLPRACPGRKGWNICSHFLQAVRCHPGERHKCWATCSILSKFVWQLIPRYFKKKTLFPRVKETEAL